MDTEPSTENQIELFRVELTVAIAPEFYANFERRKWFY